MAAFEYEITRLTSMIEKNVLKWRGLYMKHGIAGYQVIENLKKLLDGLMPPLINKANVSIGFISVESF
jgi:hypothetical protein